jgi:hypothetical protein
VARFETVEKEKVAEILEKLGAVAMVERLETVNRFERLETIEPLEMGWLRDTGMQCDLPDRAVDSAILRQRRLLAEMVVANVDSLEEQTSVGLICNAPFENPPIAVAVSIHPDPDQGA